jgi:hypothetical protein
MDKFCSLLKDALTLSFVLMNFFFKKFLFLKKFCHCFPIWGLGRGFGWNLGPGLSTGGSVLSWHNHRTHSDTEVSWGMEKNLEVKGLSSSPYSFFFSFLFFHGTGIDLGPFYMSYGPFYLSYAPSPFVFMTGSS